MPSHPELVSHPCYTRRTTLQAGVLGLMGLGLAEFSGRDHWGPAMTVLLAGGGVRGGTVIGATDKMAAYPVADRQTPENLAATIYQALGIPRSATWKDIDGRPSELYRAEPIPGLFANRG